MSVHIWQCGNGHLFSFGDEPWHFGDDAAQFLLHDGSPVPRFCTADWDEADMTDDEGAAELHGEPCMDSSSLIDQGVTNE